MYRIAHSTGVNAAEQVHPSVGGSHYYTIYLFLFQAQLDSLNYAISNATVFLEKNYFHIPSNDYLSLAMTALALSKMNSPVGGDVFNLLMTKATNDRMFIFS